MHRSAAFIAAAALLSAACASPSRKTAAVPAPAKPAAVAVAAPAPAPAAKPAASPAPAMPSGKLDKLSGVASAVDAAAGTVTVSAKGMTRVLRVAQGAKITKGGDFAAIDLKAVAAGDRVSLTYEDGVLASLHVKVGAPMVAAKVAATKLPSPKPAKGGR